MNQNQQLPFISLIIPVYNGGETFQRCLEGVQATTYSHWECLVVDDGSTDQSRELARRSGARVMSSPAPRSGPAMARNVAAEVAQGAILFFIDADVLLQPETVGQMAAIFEAQPQVAACFGSYDDAPSEANFLSQYKNLMHHYVHQRANEDASTFWTGCGAIRREVFLAMGGFSSNYARPSIEDIELGYRLRAQGYRIRLDKQLQVKHLKRWTVRSLLLSDIRDRAIPWTRLLLEESELLNDLNLETTQRVSVVAAFIGIIGTLISPFHRRAIMLVALSITLLLTLNSSFYRFLADKKGLRFMVQALPWHWLYFTYSGLCFGFIWLSSKIKNIYKNHSGKTSTRQR